MISVREKGNVMKKFLISVSVAAMTGLAAPASAALIEFDVSGLFMENAGTGGIYVPTGTFRWDNVSFAVTDVNVTTPFSGYSSGFYYSADESFVLSGSGPSGMTDLVINLFGNWFNDLESGSPGDTFFFGAHPLEVGSGLTILGSGVDPTLFARILPDPGSGPAPVPVPAGLPLLLGALGGLALFRKRGKA